MKILVIDDDPVICDLLIRVINDSGWEGNIALNGIEGIDALKDDKYDLVFLDLNLPYKSGDSVLIELRKFSDVPVIVISAKDLVSSKVDLLKLGADDYVTKPFDIDELTARAEATMRRHSTTKKDEPKILRHKEMEVNLDEKTVTIDNKPLQLTNKEFLILELLMKHPNKVFSKQNIFESVWKDTYFDDWHTVNVHINSLRTKINKLNSNEEYIQTIWNVGYRLKK